MTAQFARLADEITRNYLRFCYDCTDAAGCDTEAKCLACWEDREQALAGEQGERKLTGHYLRLQFD